MVRSKFPGKPSKIVNRRVVKANKYCVLQDTECSKAAENISYGLAVFNETFGDHEQVLTAFHGFSPHEVDEAREIAIEQHGKVDVEYQNSGLNFLPEDAFPVKIDLPSPQVLAYVEANLSVIGPVGWHTTRAQCQNLQSEEADFSKSVSSLKLCSPHQNTIKKHVANRLLQKAKKTNLEVSKFVLPSRSARSSRVIKPNKRFLDNEESDKDDTLPSSTSSRSLPTRVIELKKPRLIFDGKDASPCILSNGTCSIGATALSREHSREQMKLTDLNVFGAPTTRPKRNASQPCADGSPPKDGSFSSLVSMQVSGVISPSRSKLILRESKLNVCSATEKLKEGLFSMKPKKGLSVKVVKSPGTSVECGVCGAVRFRRLTKQALKFGSTCCDACHKFIAKMMVRARSSENSVPCENGQGNCAVSSPLKSETFATKVNRCGACWLLLCVQRLPKIPEKIRDDLIRMLPANMQGMTVVLPPVTIVNHVAGSKNKRRREPMSVSQDVVQKLSPKSSTGVSPSNARKLSASSASKRLNQTPVARIKRKAALVSLANNLRRVRDKAYSVGSTPTPSKKCPSTRDTLEKPHKIKKFSPSKSSELHSRTADKGARMGALKTMGRNKDGQIRQKLSLKGPRVKHVCRSASIVLGQPLALFPVKSLVSPSDSDIPSSIKDESIVLLSASEVASDLAVPSSKDKCDLVEMPHNAGRKTLVTFDLPEKEMLTAKLASTEPNMKLIPKTAPESRVSHVSATGRKVTKHPHTSIQSKVLKKGYRRTLQDLGVYNQTDVLPELISLDFLESYDPDEVCNSGFGLIGFDPFLMKPICFLCGSAGKQKLIHCASCCEPYHKFCVEMDVLGGPAPVQQSIKDKDGWRVDWVCPRCTVCHECGYNTGHQLTVCQRCHHSYHLECLGTSTLRKSAGDRLSVCSACLRCKSCNSTDVSKFVGNLPFCKVCFRLRQKGNFCPLCQGCYTDDDFQSKMMECAECKSWVHAKCEGLSDEKYQVLSYLPESVEFICRLCCACPPAPWWLAVEAELQAGYINIIKAITKNRKAYAMLKWSPQKTCDCQQKPIAPALRFSNPGIAPGKRRLSFNIKSQEQECSSPATLDLYEGSEVISSFKEDQISSVFEFDDDIDGGENEPIMRYIHAKGKNRNDPILPEKPGLLLDCGGVITEKSEKHAQFSPNADSGVGSTDDELKTCTEEEYHQESKRMVEGSQECVCTRQNSKHPFLTLLTIKKKVQSSKYLSIIQFHQDMDQLISEADSQEVKELYHQTLQDVFPWFDPKYDKISRNSFPLSPCKPHHGSLLQYHSHDTSPEKPNSNLMSSYVLEKLLPKDAKELDHDYFYYGTTFTDTRICSFCKLTGDSDATAEGRLLYCGQNEWVHVNCALWSAEVFEEIDGALQNVSNALSRGRMIRCSECGKKGASVGCCAKKCEETLHFPCARMSGFVFMEDKNVFCSSHARDAPGKPLNEPSDFDVARPVFVELDRRKKKGVESQHARLMIGSLFVQSLGNIVPEMSDQELVLVPTEFCCTRLFWSSKEPWRIVQYTISTSIQFPTPEPVTDLGYHVTVDHSKETSGGVSKLNLDCSLQIPCFRDTAHEGGESDNKDSKLPCDNEKIVGAVMSHIIDTVCSREADDEGTDVPNSADLLPPELKDAIFDELPHDLLDGISMQDIFQDRFLSFEELSKDEPEDACATKSKSDTDKCKKVKNLKTSRELKRSKSDVLPGNSSQTDGQLHQRSCSLAWKLSATEVVMDRTKLIQELRLSVKPASSVDLRYCLAGPGDKGKENQSVSWPRIMQVDGVADEVLNCSDEGSDVETLDTMPSPEQKRSPNSSINVNFFKESELLCNRIECLKTVTSAALSQTSSLGNSSHTVNQVFRKCKRRRLGRKVSTSDLMRELLIPQVDGTNDISSDSDQEEACGTIFQEQCDDKPVRCNRCGCTYRTEESYARHLPSCSGDFSLTTSESEAEISEEENASTSKSVSAPSPDSAISVSSSCLLTAPPVSPLALPPVLAPTPLTLKAQSIVSASQHQDQAAALFTNNSMNVMSIRKDQNAVKNNVIATVSKVQKTSASKSKTTKTASHQQTLKLTVKGNKTVLQHQQLYQHNSQQQISQHAIQHALSASMAQQPQMITMLDYQQSQQSAPTVLVQSVPSQAMVPAYLEAFQQHTGQNLQYLTTVDSSGGFGKTQYLAAVPSAVLPGAFQLQPIADGQLCLEPSPVGIPALSGIQLAPTQLAPAPIAHTQPQVLGTLLQNPLSCGVMAAAEPIYETIQMFPDQSGGVLLASQPMLTCMETVVSNTFMSMSSSQFVSSSVPGMLQGSSTYSTTTTQVFQASKVDPPVMDVPTQYVVVNTHPSLSDATVGKLEVMTISQPQMQDQAPLQSQTQIQMSSINLPVSVSVSAPVSLQSLPPAATSSIAPIPKMQPQRTYSKPSKVLKDSGVRKPVQPLTCAAVKETIKVLTSQPPSKGTKDTPFCVASNIGPSCMKGSMSGWLPEKTVAFKSSDVRNSTSSAAQIQVPSHLITTSTAPAQSITLPDPVQLNPTTNGPKIVSESVPAAKCPPVTFSYRTHAIEKSKPKKSSALVGSTGTSKMKVDVEIKPLVVQTGKQESTCLKTSQMASQLVTSLSTSGSFVAKEVDSKIICSLTSSKPTSDMTPVIQSREILGQKQIGSVEVSTCNSPSLAAVNDSCTQSDVAAVPVSCSLTSVQSVASAPPLACHPVALGSSSAQNQVGKNVLSLTTASLTNSLTSTTTNPTASTNSSLPVATTKLQSSTVAELKPLKEINQASLNSDLRPNPTKIQDKVPASVSTILKSASQNVDVPKKNDGYCSLGDIPIVLSSKDNSSASLKLLFQKQAHNGCYTVSSPGKKDSELMAVKLADISIVTNGIRDRKGGKAGSENVEPVEKGSKKNQLGPSAPEIIYEIHCQDGFSYTSTSLSDAWHKVFGAVQEARANHKMPPLIHNPFNSIESSHNVMGLSNNSVKYLLEQLPGVGDCRKYRPIYHKSRLPGPGYRIKREDLDLMNESRSGCARTEPYLSAKKYDMFSWLDSRHRRPPKLLDNNDIDALTGSRRTASTSLPMAMRYRHLRETSKTSVGVFRSDIHGRGLFCLRDIEAGEMVIEYAGEVIRNTLTDNREKYYQSKGIGCYMFKVDDNFTVDATVKGNAARFINHSCEPNCYSRVVDILGKKHIIIFAFRRIPQGEELTYDYKFPIEEEKIHCHCLARRCRKYLN